MYTRLNAARGIVSLRVSGEMPQGFLNLCAEQGIELFDIRFVDVVNIEVKIKSSDAESARTAAIKSCCETVRLNEHGLGRLGKRLKLRFFPFAAAFVFIALLFITKFYVWEISVYGNNTVASSEILDALALSGVESGAFWPAFSADSIRSEVLSRIPELGWVTVNMHGSLAEVIVVERREAPELQSEKVSSDIIAGKAGFITRISTLAGQQAVKTGDAVHEGQLLISGVVESSFAPPDFVNASGSVKAEINSELTAAMPETERKKEYTGREKKKYALILGNNRINFYSDSSICDGFCDKIISVWKAERAGLFSLPLSLLCISEREYDLRDVTADKYEAGLALRSALVSERAMELGEAEILSEKLSCGESGGLLTAALRTRCVCDIGESAPIDDARRAQAEENFNRKADER